MTLSIQPIDPVSRPFFGGEVSGIDITRPLTPQQASAIEKGMDQFGVLVFHGQHFDDATQLAFSRNFGDLEEASGDLNWGKARRIESELVNDISNLDNDNQVLARDSRRRLFSLGNRLWHSDSSFKVVPAKYSLLSARIIPDKGGNTEFADMRAA
ncbi:MAG: alpha-ketoglutarate-dependent 2,4-dichlorophenoxyacetate dioxygenase, partial [Acetobacteraceae bacterium]|nr:alpha-ketoglutarate-dependent 2,4-dichlorophenoxyacetate dioxygenase [Acetobacteraceae bacterium]